MAKIKSLNDIEVVLVHWSESNMVNLEMDCDESGDIEKCIDAVDFDDLIKRASSEVGCGFDKTVLTIRLKSGGLWCSESKFRIQTKDTGLLSLINKSE